MPLKTICQNQLKCRLVLTPVIRVSSEELSGLNVVDVITMYRYHHHVL